MPELKLSWLGPPLIELSGRPVKLEMRKVAALLAYVSLHEGDISRETLAAIFWPENDQTHALGSLRRSLSSLSISLESMGLNIARETVSLKQRELIEIDIEEFQQRMRKVNLHHPLEHFKQASQPHKRGLTVCSDCMTILEEAVDIYRGDFLEGFNLKNCPDFDDWQFYHRESLRRELGQALQYLVLGYESKSEWEPAIQVARRWVSMDRLNEPAQRALIRLYRLSGQRSAALRQYDNLARLLQEELGQEPESETIRLYEFIQAADVPVKRQDVLPSRTEQTRVSAEEPLLKTKLYVPYLRVENVPRPRLLQVLETGSKRALTLISAPAGFGKSTILAQWAAFTSLPVAWYSIDEGDNDPTRFLAYLIAALDSVAPGIKNQFHDDFLSFQPSIQPAVARLINLLATLKEPIILVLDDYQFIQSQEVHKALVFLLEQMIPFLHIVISTRVDPPFPLARLRVRDHLVEVRASDLRFSMEETSGFFKRVMLLDLTQQDISAIEARTEGWIAGLQMAALAIRTIDKPRDGKVLVSGNNQRKISEFINAFSGSHRYILDYLGEEVLSHRSEETRRFLLQTSVLDRFCGSLCDALTGSDNSQSILQEIEKENLFLVPLDNERHWFRYHHFFTELLRYQLEDTLSREPVGEARLPGLDELHLRAANWFERENLLGEAIQHDLAARNYEQAANLIEAKAQEMLYRTGQAYTLLEWLSALPVDIFQLKPRLYLAKAWTFISQSQFSAAVQPLEVAAQVIQGRLDAGAESMKGEMALIHGVLAQLGNRDVDVMREQSLLALKKLPQTDSMLRSIAAWLLGASYFWDGEILEAEQFFRQAVQLGREANNTYISLVSTVDLNDVLREQGRYREAYQLLLQTEQEISSGGYQPLPMHGQLYISLSQMFYQWDQLEEAERYLHLGIELVGQDIPREILFFGLAMLPYLKFAQGQREEALKLAEDCLERLQFYPMPYVPNQIKSKLIPFWIQAGAQDRIEEWLGNCAINPDHPIRYSREMDYSALAKALLWQGRSEDAQMILAKLEDANRSGGWTRKLCYTFLLQALVFHHQKNLDHALTALENSLKLAQSEGYVRLYVDEGKPVKELLLLGSARHVWSRVYLEGYVNRLLKAFQEDCMRHGEASDRQSDCFSAKLPAAVNTQSQLVEPLSKRELEVLRLAANGLTNPQIGETLKSSVGTIKTHLHHIFTKLGVEGRIGAITLAKELHIL